MSNKHTYIIKKRGANISGVLFLLCFLSYQLAFSFLNINGESRFLDRSLFILVLMIEMFGTLLLYYHTSLKGRTFLFNDIKYLVNSLVGFLCVVLCHSIVELAIGDEEKVLTLLPTIIGTCTALPATLYFCRYITNVEAIARICFWSLFSIASFSFIYSFWKGLNGSFYYLDDAFRTGNNIGYNFVILTPLALIAYKDKKWIGLILLLILSLFVFFSAKRGAIVTQVAVLFVMLIKSPYKFSKYSYLLLVFFTVLAIFPSVSYIAEMESSPLERFRASGGSGRDLIYSRIFNGILDSSFVELIFGHGFYATKDLTGILFGTHSAQAAHNDWLEIMYDFGLVGITSYACIPIYLIRLLNKYGKQYRFEVRVLLLLLVIFLIKSNVSMMFADKESIAFYISMGLILLQIKNNSPITKNIRNKK